MRIHKPSLVVLVALLAAGCASSTDLPTATFSESGDAAIVVTSGPAVYATLVITNASATAQTINWYLDCTGAGAFDLRAYRVVGASRVLVWDSAKLPRLTECPTQLVQRTLNPGDPTFIHRFIAIAQILGDSLAAGPYDLALVPRTTPAIPDEVSAPTLALFTAIVDPPGPQLSLAWIGSSHGVSLALTLAWSADSVTGTGTFTASPDNTLGCGGGTLKGTGTVTFAALRTQGQVQGRMSFSNGWIPPYSGALSDATTLVGSFMSIDAGPCPLTLTKLPG